MRYRGFIITSCPDKEIIRNKIGSDSIDICNGFYCEVFAGNDCRYDDRLDYFCLAEGYEITDCSNDSMEKGIRMYIDDMYTKLTEAREDSISNRNALLLGKAICFIGEFQMGEELYDTLANHLNMDDDEIRKIGFISLVPYFDRHNYAKIIADYMTDIGTQSTQSGNWYFDFSEINERYGVNLPSDRDMLDKIVDCFNRSIVADIDVTENFDIIFYTAFCPNYDSVSFGEEDISY